MAELLCHMLAPQLHHMADLTLLLHLQPDVVEAGVLGT